MLLDGNLRGVQHLGIPVADIEAAKAWYVEKLGFTSVHEPVLPTPEGDIRVAFLERLGLMLECYQLVGRDGEAVKTRGHGAIDHFALDVVDMAGALAEAQRRGAKLDPATPDGPVTLPTFWSNGVQYTFLTGPMGEKVEFNQRFDLSPTRREENVGGWSHLGIPVVDLEAAIQFYAQFGFVPVMRARVEGEPPVDAAMLEKDNFVLEFYQLPATAGVDGHIDHIAFDVADIEAAFNELHAAGFATLETAPVLLPFWERGDRYFNIRGPNGEKVEFNQILGR